MIKTYKLYSHGTKVYAIAFRALKEEPKIYCAIFDAIVNLVSVEYDVKQNKEIVYYLLTTPDGRDWGDVVPEEDVNTNINVLFNRMKKIWKANSNTH